MSRTILSTITDQPRIAKNDESDSFNIEPFEKGLIKFISKAHTPITIALQGEWGSGKTSLMNSLEYSLCSNEDPKFHHVWLNTWEYALMNDVQSTLIDIITALVAKISAIADLDRSEVEKVFNKVNKIGQSVLKAVAKTAADNTLNGSSAVIDALCGNGTNSSVQEIHAELQSIVTKTLEKKGKQGVIFFIDDLDRIDPPVAVQLLELLKNIFNLKGCVFVLAIDYDVVVKGLEPKFGKLTDSNEREFRSFFDKIIQVPFSMPVSAYRIDDFLKASLMDIGYLTEGNAGNKKLIAKFTEVCQLSVGTNPRSIKRLLNSLSLINCINDSDHMQDDEDQFKDELNLLINFALVSIQIAYPPVYRLLNSYPGFDNWDEKVATNMNLKEVDAQHQERLKATDEFDEDWEMVLFRLCENDHYLKKKALNISRLMNVLKKHITESNKKVEHTVQTIISLSSVTNVDNDLEPRLIEYHQGEFLKGLRDRLIPALKEKLPAYADEIAQQGRRIQTNLYIKLTEEDWENWFKFSSNPIPEGIQLAIISNKEISWQGSVSFEEILEKTNTQDYFEEIKNDFSAFARQQPVVYPKELNTIIINGYYAFDFSAYIRSPSLDEFYTPERIDAISNLIADIFGFYLRLEELGKRIEEHPEMQS